MTVWEFVGGLALYGMAIVVAWMIFQVIFNSDRP